MSTRHPSDAGRSGRTIGISKLLSAVLRHRAPAYGLKLGPDGFIRLNSVLAIAPMKRYHPVTIEEIEEIVATCPKQRFALKGEGRAMMIRANQGHTLKSVDDESLLRLIEDPSSVPICVHGTYYKSWDIIRETGLNKMKRNHIHFAVDVPKGGKAISGARGDSQLYIFVDVKRAMASGIKFYRSINNVVLSPGDDKGYIPSRYFASVSDAGTGAVIFSGEDAEEEERKVEPTTKGAVAPPVVPVRKLEATVKPSGASKPSRGKGRVAHLDRPSKTGTGAWGRAPGVDAATTKATTRGTGGGGGSGGGGTGGGGDSGGAASKGSGAASKGSGGGKPARVAGGARPTGGKCGFRYLAVLDFEATCQEKGRIKPQEIIEFPTVIVDTETNTVVDEFHTYIKPVHNPILTAFATELTGITQAMVDKGVVFAEAMKQHLAFMNTKGYSTSVCYVTCGDWDLNTALPHQMKHSIPAAPEVPATMRAWINIKKVANNVFGQKVYGMTHLLEKLGLKLVGRHHSGIDDTRNIARCLIELIKRGYAKQLNPTGFYRK